MEFTSSSSNRSYQLTLNEMTEDLQSPAKCKVCKEVCVGPTYSCNGFPDFFLHESCAELPLEFQSPYHHHPLHLGTVDPDDHDDYRGACHDCHEDVGLFAYFCLLCPLSLDLRCALLKPTIDEGQDHLLHFSHFHPLILKNNHAACCSLCEEFSHGAFYICEPCKFYLHQSCSHLFEEKVQYFLHDGTLTFSKHRPIFGNVCGPCGGEITSKYYYSCLTPLCKFKMHISCALLPSKMESEGLNLFHHFSHSHPLTLGNTNPDDEINCAICHRRCSGQTYVCCRSECKSFSLHQSCFDLPRIIRHQIHERHPLILMNNEEFLCHELHRSIMGDYEGVTFPQNNGIHVLCGESDDKKCFVCSVTCVGFIYHCRYCLIYLDVVCLTKISVIKYQGHEHNLFFSPNWNRPNSRCHSCGTKPDMSSPIHSPLFRCVECDFFLHLKCGPLPCAIGYEDHDLHPLTLTDSPVVSENEERDGTDQFVCDSCEKVDRDPRLPVYYCHEGCHYLAEFECVLAKVIRSLMGELGEVILKTPIRHVPGMVIVSSIFEEITDPTQAHGHYQINHESTFKHIPESFNDSTLLTHEEMDELRSVIKASEADISQDSSEVVSLIIYTAKSLIQKMQQSVNNCGDSIINETKPRFQELLNHVYNWQPEKVVRVGDHLVPLSVAPILEDLCAKYGDIGAESILRSAELKTYFVALLCGTIKSMYATRVVDVSKNWLANRWVNLKLLQFAGFKVQFAFDRLNSVMYAYNGIQIEDEAKHKHEELRCEIEEVSQAIEQLKAELATKTNMLEALKKRSKNIASEPEFTGFKGDCLRKASALRWKVAGEGIL